MHREQVIEIDPCAYPSTSTSAGLYARRPLTGRGRRQNFAYLSLGPPKRLDVAGWVLIRRRSLDGMGPMRGNSLAMTKAGGAHMSRRSLRPGRVIRGLPVLVFSAVGKLRAQPRLYKRSPNRSHTAGNANDYRHP